MLVPTALPGIRAVGYIPNCSQILTFYKERHTSTIFSLSVADMCFDPDEGGAGEINK